MPRVKKEISKSLAEGLRVTTCSLVGVANTPAQYNLLRALAGLYQVLSPDEILKLSQTPAPHQPGQHWYGAVVIIVALNYFDYFEQISKTFNNLGDLASYFDRFLEILGPDSSRLHSALADFYAVSIRFSTSALQFLKKSTTGQIFKSIWQPFKLSFQGLEEELARQQKSVEDAIELAREEVAFKAHQEMSLFRREGRNHHLLMIQNHAENQSTNSTIIKRLNGIENLSLQKNIREKMVKRRSLLEAISTYNHRLSLSNACEKRHKKTGLWIFETLEYKEWNEDLKSSGLWCYGIPGAGKTILTAGVIDHLFIKQQNMTTSINYFFCDFSAEESLKASAILKSLIKQILSVFEKIPPEMERNFERQFLSSH
ncbi:uncharacterized protein LAJ45_07008 [Morchella importuna]|uniref:uncharacterized protein n=1 Tax=Morchella importuna TaxID=1174673 RepID=UPI001E8DCF5C|nr:uncharacterized protein LAJ45_07008 [Morchella importuna]KAH8149032.1 hypothetical protein LAJ45_07008 [Morchella importuna]